MSAEHVAGLLSDYLDEALGPADRGRVEAHLPGCKACRDELEDLRRVSRMVKDLPKKDLPPGFLTRLRSRQKAASAAPVFPWLPMSPKALAWAATACVAVVIFAREIQYRIAPALLPSDMEAQLQSAEKAALTPEVELDRELSRRKRALDASATWRGMVEGGGTSSLDQGAPSAGQSAGYAADAFEQAAPASADKGLSYSASARAVGRTASLAGSRGALKLARPEPPPAPNKAKLKSDGAPLETAPSPPPAPSSVPGKQGPSTTSNESIYAFLKKEKSRMGIQEIIPPGAQTPAESSPAAAPQLDARQAAALGLAAQAAAGGAGGAPSGEGESPDRPLSREEAMTVMRSMASGLGKMNEDYRWKKSPTVPLGAVDQGKPRLLAKAEDSKPFSPAAAAEKAGSKDQAKAEKADNLTVPLASGARGHADDAAPAPKPAPDRGLSFKSSWSGVQGGMGAAGGAVIHRPADFQDMWSRVHFAPELPKVDFDKEMAVAVFGARSDASRAVEIVSVREEGGRMLIRFRSKTDESPSAVKPSAPYHVVIVPTSVLPFDFIQVQ